VLLIAYRATISKLYGDVCRYYPSCSAYGLTAVQQHGLVKGSALALARIVRCHPPAARTMCVLIQTFRMT
jgi:putative membrane protein insertion efficiency factor